MLLMQVCFKYSVSLRRMSLCLCVDAGVGWGGCCKGEGDGAGSGQVVRYGRNQQVGGTVAHDLIHPEAGRTEERGKEVGGLVGWRRWGSPAATDTQTQRKEVGNRLD